MSTPSICGWLRLFAVLIGSLAANPDAHMAPAPYRPPPPPPPRPMPPPPPRSYQPPGGSRPPTSMQSRPASSGANSAASQAARQNLQARQQLQQAQTRIQTTLPRVSTSPKGLSPLSQRSADDSSLQGSKAANNNVSGAQKGVLSQRKVDVQRHEKLKALAKGAQTKGSGGTSFAKIVYGDPSSGLSKEFNRGAARSVGGGGGSGGVGGGGGGGNGPAANDNKWKLTPIFNRAARGQKTNPVTPSATMKFQPNFTADGFGRTAANSNAKEFRKSMDTFLKASRNGTLVIMKQGRPAAGTGAPPAIGGPGNRLVAGEKDGQLRRHFDWYTKSKRPPDKKPPSKNPNPPNKGPQP